MAKDSRARMLTTTSKLLQRQGYHGTGLNQIVSEADAPKGSIYFHFPGGKEQLTAEAITNSASYLVGVLERHEAPTAVAAVDAYLAGVAARLQRSDFREGCPIATVALEIGAESSEIGGACAAAFDRLIERIAGWIEADGAEPSVARDRAFIILAAIEGALMVAKVKHSDEPINQLRAALPALIGTTDASGTPGTPGHTPDPPIPSSAAVRTGVVTR